jgi:hypothetical protein
MGRKRTIEITVETERIIEIRFRGTEKAAADDADSTHPRAPLLELTCEEDPLADASGSDPVR